MLQKIVAFLFIASALSGCDMKRNETIEAKRIQVASKVSIGDDIFEARKTLVANGFSIKYGPDFPTKTKSYLMMIVDYGHSPNGLEIFKYTVGIKGGDNPITGVIKATPEGKITSIE